MQIPLSSQVAAFLRELETYIFWTCSVFQRLVFPKYGSWLAALERGNEETRSLAEEEKVGRWRLCPGLTCCLYPHSLPVSSLPLSPPHLSSAFWPPCPEQLCIAAQPYSDALLVHRPAAGQPCSMTPSLGLKSFFPFPLLGDLSPEHCACENRQASLNSICSSYTEQVCP